MDLHSHQAEQIVLGSLLSQPESLTEVGKLLEDTSFYFEKHQVLWRSILSLQGHAVIPDIVTVADDLEKSKKLELVGGSSYLTQLISQAIGFPNLLHYAEIVKTKAELRSFWEFFTQKAEEIQSGKLTDPEKLQAEISDKVLAQNAGNIEKDTTVEEINRLYTTLQESYAEKMAQGIMHLGIPTHYKSLDRATDGFQPECLWSIAAFTSVGKTTFALNMARNVLRQGKRVCIFSLEMGKEDIFAKLLALEIQVSPTEITKGLLNNEIFSKQVEAKRKVQEYDLSVYTECVNIEDILLTMRSEMLKKPVDVFFLDYVQNLTSTRITDQTRLVTLAVKELQKLTRKLKTTLVLLSQVSNETNRLGGLLEAGGKDSGAIRAASNVFIYLKRDGTEEELLEKYKSGEDIPLKLVLNKNRMGRIGSFALKLKPSTGVVYEPY